MNSKTLGVLLSSLILTFIVSITFSCQHEPDLMPGLQEICFDQEIMPVIVSNCAVSGCHDGSYRELPPLTDYDQVSKLVKPGKPNASKLYSVVTTWKMAGNYMPPSPRTPLNNQQLDNLNLWIAQGAKHTTCSENGCDSTNVTFSGSILPIFNTYCTGCHSGNNPEAGIKLTDYTAVTTSVNSGRLVGSIEHLQGYAAMPQNGAKLTDCRIALINKWINDGMPNN